MPEAEDRYQGCLLGLAVGDAVGTTLEFRPPGSFSPISDMVGGGPFRLNAGEWTDDTSMALCLAASLLQMNDFDPADQMERYSRWASDGYMSSNGSCFDIGNTVRRALRRFRFDGNPFAGSTDPSTAGNGSIMRLAPVPMFFGNDPGLAISYSGKSSQTTHGARTCIDACRYFGGLLWAALHGSTKEELLSDSFSPVGSHFINDLLCPEISEVASGSFKKKNPPEIRGTGYVVQSLEAALWAFHHSQDFRSGCLMASNLGDDADTTAAVYGQLAGVFYGRNGIPSEWLSRLAMMPMITDLADELWRCSKNH